MSNVELNIRLQVKCTAEKLVSARIVSVCPNVHADIWDPRFLMCGWIWGKQAAIHQKRSVGDVESPKDRCLDSH